MGEGFVMKSNFTHEAEQTGPSNVILRLGDKQV